MKRALLLAAILFGCGRTLGVDIPKPQVQTQPLRGCDGQAVVVLEEGRTLTRVTASGATKLFTFGAGLAADQVSVSQWNVAGGFIGGVAYVGGDTNAYSYEYVLLSAADGAVKFHTTKVEPHSPSVFLGADGTLAVAARTGWLARADGTVTELGALMPMTAVLPGGAVVVARGMPWVETSEKGVWKDGAFTPVTLDPYAALQVVGARAVYVSGSTLVSVTDALRVSLPVSGLQFVQQAGDRFVLLASSTDAVVVDLTASTATRIANVPEPHERYSAWSAGLQSDGAVLAGIARGDLLQLQRTGDLGATWSDVGEPMAMGQDFGLGRWLLALEHSGSVMTLSMSTGYGHYVNELQLTSARGTFRLATGEVYVNGDLTPGAADLSGDGQCAAAWVSKAPSQVMDLTFMDHDGKQTVVHSLAQAAWLRFSN